MDEEVRGPFGVSHNDEKPEGWCEVICVIPELKVKKRLSGVNFTQKPDSGKFSCKFLTRSLKLEVECVGRNKKTIKYAYSVDKLPDEIDPDESKVKYREGKVVLCLKKVEARSWQRDLQANGLDQQIDEEEELLEKGE